MELGIANAGRAQVWVIKKQSGFRVQTSCLRQLKRLRLSNSKVSKQAERRQ